MDKLLAWGKRLFSGKQLAFVFSGGGSRGALQVGALYALLEHNFEPKLLVGTSIGAVNATFLALHGFSKASLDLLTAAWHDAMLADLLPANYIWLSVRAMVGRSDRDPSRRIQEFFIKHGVTPELCFSEIQQPRLGIVSADLNTGKPVLYGESPDDKILEALLLSTALPPWAWPVRKQGRYLVDGGVISNLPVEPALRFGATQIIALDLSAPEVLAAGDGFGGLIDRVIFAVGKRQADLELELAEARGVPILYLGLSENPPVSVWDFQHTDELIEQGYEIARRILDEQDWG